MFLKESSIFSLYGVCFRAAMHFYASNLSFCPKPFPVHGTPVDWNNFIWIFQLNTDLRLKCHCCGKWFNCCCFAACYIHAVCIFTSATAELSVKIPSLDMKGEECPQFLLTSAEANGTHVFVEHCRMSSAMQITIHSVAGWKSSLFHWLHGLWSLKIFSKVYGNVLNLKKIILIYIQLYC